MYVASKRKNICIQKKGGVDFVHRKKPVKNSTSEKPQKNVSYTMHTKISSYCTKLVPRRGNINMGYLGQDQSKAYFIFHFKRTFEVQNEIGVQLVSSQTTQVDITFFFRTSFVQ